MGKSITLDFDKIVEFCVEFCNDRIEHFDFLVTLLFTCIYKESGYRLISHPAVKSALLDLYGQDTSEVWSKFPPTREDYNIMEKHLKEAFGNFTLVTPGVDYQGSLKNFLENGLEELSKIDVQNPECYLQIVQACHIMRDAYVYLRDFDVSSKKYVVSSIVGFLRNVEQLSLFVTARAYEVVGYQKAKMRRFESTKPGTKGKRAAMMERVRKFAEEVKRQGEEGEDGISISRNKVTEIFKTVETYSDPTKRKYRKMAEEILEQKILYKK